MTIDPLAPENTPNLTSKPNPTRGQFTLLPLMLGNTPVPSSLANDDLSGLNYLYPECPKPIQAPVPKLGSLLPLATEQTSGGCGVVEVVEPTSTLSLIALGTLGAASTLKRKLKSSKSSEKETTTVS